VTAAYHQILYILWEINVDSKIMTIASVVGARPNIIKMAPIHRKIITQSGHLIIHTGQHYDYTMSEIFFKEFDLPEPTFNLDVGSGTANYQIGQMIIRLEGVLVGARPDLVLVYGDTNSTLAGALAARKRNIPIGHIEAGLRSFDRRMPEETNRIITDHISDYLFAPTQTAINNLRKEHVQGKIFYTGDISVEIVNKALDLKSRILSEIKISPSSYILFTMHRAENTDCKDVLRSIVDSIKKIDNKTIVFPIHPRTKKAIEEIGLYHELEKSQNLRLISPVGYVDLINLIKNASMVVTDSGGIQKEAYLLGTPCITLRQNTEWVETVSENWNKLVGTEKEALMKAIREWIPSSNARKPIFGDGKTSTEILNIIRQVLQTSYQ
jgi:UDP-GlcNAc3NAcA epimerase